MAVTYPALTVVGGTTITATWGNTVRDGVYIPFTDSTDRDTYITSPAEGMCAYLKDVNNKTWYDGTRWCPEAGQVIARGNRTTSSTTTTTEVGVIRISAALKSGQLYMIKTSPLLLNTTVSGDYIASKLRYTTDGSTPTTSSTILTTIAGPAGGAQTHIPMMAKYIPSSDLTFGVLLTVGRSAGSGTVGLVANTNVPDIDLIIIACGTAPSDSGVDI